MRQLCLMAEGAQRERWNHTSAVLAMLANVNRNPKSKPVMPDQLNPFTERDEPPQTTFAEHVQQLKRTLKR